MPKQDGPMRSQVLSTRPAKGIIASGQRVVTDSTKRAGKPIRAESWQALCWKWFDQIGEYRFSVEWVGNLLSKAKLTLIRTEEDGTTTVIKPGEPVYGGITSLFGGPVGQTEMFRQLGNHFTAAGDCYILAATNEEDEDDWLVAAPHKLKQAPGSAAGNMSYTIGTRTYRDALAIRLWKPHPVDPDLADAPSRAVLPILAEIDGLTKHVMAQIDSRLMSAGILLLPSEVSFGSAPTATQETTGEGDEAETVTTEGQTSADDIVAKLIEVASTAIGDRDSAAALVPVVMQVAGEWIGKIKHLRFWSELDKESINLRTEAIRRLALGMDMPPEVLEGTGEMNHWSSWQVEEASIKSHTEPLLAVIVSSLTSGWLRPYLMEVANLPKEEAAKYSYGVDTSEMRLRPNRSKEAIELWLEGALSLDAALRENGFVETDKMTDKEKQARLLWKLASGSTTPRLVALALKQMGVDGIEVPPEAGTTEARPDRSLADHPTRELPEKIAEDKAPKPSVDPIAAASSIIIRRALERAGNRLRTRMGGRRMLGVSAQDTYLHIQVMPDEVDALLTDAWGMADEFAADFQLDGAAFREQLDSYTRQLLLEQKPVDVGMLSSYLSLTRSL